MNDKNKLIYRRATYLQIGVCGVLFSLFSFIYLYAFQPDIIGALHYALSHGRTHYDPLAGAVILTFVLLLFRWGINKLMGLKGPVRSLAYFPSCLILGVLTDVHHDTYHGGNFADYWQWMLPLILGVYVVVVYTMRRAFRQWLNREITPGALWNSNLIILLACCSMTIAIGTTDVNFHRELKVERRLAAGDCKGALSVGKKSIGTTRTLNALRAYALSLDGRMGDALFEYPQPYGVNGLMFPSDTMRTLRMRNDSLVKYLHLRHRKGETVIASLEREFNSKDGSYTIFDYYLCALLLDKQLDRFVKVAEQNLEEDSMPRHYREALALYAHLHPTYHGLQSDSLTRTQLDTYLTRRAEFASSEEKNHMRREFGDTYWWYYQYQ